MESILARVSDVVTQDDISPYSYLSRVQLPVSTADKAQHVGLLIRNNLPSVHEPLEVINSVNNGPYAITTLLGWAIHGLSRPTSEYKVIHRINLQPSREQQWEKMYNMDFTERLIDNVPDRSIQDKQFITYVTHNTRHVHEHYEVSLPFKGSIQLPNNKQQVETTAAHLKRKLDRNHQFAEDYKKCI